MKIIIQCAGKKQNNAACLQTENGKKVLFVAKPELTDPSPTYEYFHPDDLKTKDITWRQALVDYNKKGKNELNLLPAYKVYSQEIYRKLVHQFGAENVFILSAGWGLISANFLTPNYNITFSSNDKSLKRTYSAPFDDINMLPMASTDDLLFLGGLSYLKLYDKLTESYAGRRIVFYNSAKLPGISNCDFIKFETTQKTNWHYACAKKLMKEKLLI